MLQVPSIRHCGLDPQSPDSKNLQSAVKKIKKICFYKKSFLPLWPLISMDFLNEMNMKNFTFYAIAICMAFCSVVKAQTNELINLNDQTVTVRTTEAPVMLPESVKDAMLHRAFTLNPVLQRADIVKAGDAVDLELFDNIRFTAIISSVTTNKSGTLSIVFKLPDYPMAFGYITTGKEGKSLFMLNVPELNQTFSSHSSIYSDVSYLMLLDQSKQQLRLGNDEAKPAVTLIEGVGSNVVTTRSTSGCSVDENLQTADPAIINVLVVYTAAAAGLATSSGSDIETVIAGAEAIAKNVLYNQGNGDEIHIVFHAQVDYVENPNTLMDDDLALLTGQHDGVMDEVHQLRLEKNADFVVLLVENNLTDGLAWILDEKEGDPNLAFSVVNVQMASSTTALIHQIGHNLGMHHEEEHYLNELPKTKPMFEYAWGWYWTGNDDIEYGSVMSTEGVGTYYFSNHGLSDEGVQTGNANADNARVFREMKHKAAIYSDRLQNLPAAPVNIEVSNPTQYGATFSWDVAENADSYVIFFARGGNAFSGRSTTDTLITIDNTHWFSNNDCTEYEFYVRAVNDCGYTNSATKTFQTSPCAGISSVTVKPQYDIVQAGGASLQFTAQVVQLSAGLLSDRVIWSVEGEQSGPLTSSTTISDTGVLTVALDETEQILNVIATSFADNTIYGSAIVEVEKEVVVLGTTLIWEGTTDDDWFEASNWDINAVPTALDTVIIPSSPAVFPVLTAPATVAEIHFEPRAQLKYQSKLTGKAFVSYDFNNKRKRWNMLSMPLQQAYPGDFTFGGYPLTWMYLFKTQLVNTTMHGVWDESPDLLTPFKAGDAFLLWLDDNDIQSEELHKGLKLLDNVREIPFFDHHHNSLFKVLHDSVHQSHDYLPYTPYSQPLSNPQTTDLRAAVDPGGPSLVGTSTFFKFTFDSNIGEYLAIRDGSPGNSYEVPRYTTAFELVNLPITRELNFGKNTQAGGGNVTLVGNPYMATLDFEELYAANDEAISTTYQIWTDKGYEVYSPEGLAGPEGSALNQYIAPLQGFVVTEAFEAKNTILNFNESMTTVEEPVELHATASVGNKLDIVARNPVAGILTFIAKREGGQDSFCNLDARKIMDTISDIPEIYTLKPYKGNFIATAINIINNDDLFIPIGIATSYAGEITLSFSGMDAYDAYISLVDLETNFTVDLTGMASYNYAVNYSPKQVDGKAVACENRFFIRISSTSTTGTPKIISEKVNVFESNGLLQIISGESNLIREVAVYNMQGMTLYHETAINASSHTVNSNWPAGVYVVKVVSENGTENIRVIK